MQLILVLYGILQVSPTIRQNVVFQVSLRGVLRFHCA